MKLNALCFPCSHVGKHMLSNTLSEFHGQLVVLERRQDCSSALQPAGRMLPSQQRFEARDLSSLQRHLGLVVRDEDVLRQT